MIRRPPRSTLFPYPPLSRSGAAGMAARLGPPRDLRRGDGHRARAFRRLRRSEEHTSELQSHLNLVCRLLLEKKKKKNKGYQFVSEAMHASVERGCTESRRLP